MIDLSLNIGSSCPQACVDVMRTFAMHEALRLYSEIDNRRLKKAIAAADHVGAERVYLANGSGPLLKQCIPYVIRRRVMALLLRMPRHLVNVGGYPVITPTFTYSKVPQQAGQRRLAIRLLPMAPETGLRIEPEDIARALRQQAGFVYLCNPNNPTGQVMLARDPLIELLESFPGSTFWIDEAYVHYLSPLEYRPVSVLVPRYPNLMVSRSFSVAYGLAALRVGYLLASAALVAIFEGQVTGYRLGLLQEEMALAAHADTEHLPAAGGGRPRPVRPCARARSGSSSIRLEGQFRSCAFHRQPPRRCLGGTMLTHGIRIKSFSPFEHVFSTPTSASPSERPRKTASRPRPWHRR
jgi:histidinol-phosphate aminotransferase